MKPILKPAPKYAKNFPDTKRFVRELWPAGDKELQ